jgi:hypothetical protein
LTAEQTPEDALVPASGMIEGEFTEIIPPQTTTEQPPEATKRKLSPAMLALVTILGLFALCCLMAIIIFFLVYPTARNAAPTGYNGQTFIVAAISQLTF